MTKRIFAAVEIPENVRETTAEYSKNLRNNFSYLKIGWEKREKLHLTLKFFGDADEVQIQKISEILKDAAANAKTFEIAIGETGVFPNARNPRVLWLGVKHDKEKTLEKITFEIENGTEKLGFKREIRKFNPHLTIARLREPQKSREIAAFHLKQNFEPISFLVAEIVLFQSNLQKAGSVYKQIESFSLNSKSESAKRKN